jgi:hypothetical protein
MEGFMGDDVREQFLEHVKDHSMNIELDHGVHRCIKFSKDNSSVFYFRVTTWPGHLCISGDMGTYVFARLPDMFEFFRGDELKINPGYWTEKLQSISCFGSKEGAVKEFDAEGTLECVKNRLDDDEDQVEKYSEQLKDLSNATDVEEALQIMEDIDCLSDAWECLYNKLTFHIQWCLYAIRWAIMQYDKPKAIAA